MSPLLVALLGMLVIPLFVATWRASLFGLACQGLLMALVAHRLDPHPATPGAWIELVDLALVRGLAAPVALYAVMHAQKAASRSDVIPPNLLSWTVALAMVLVSFSFAGRLVAEHGDQRMLIAVAGSGLLLGFLVLSTQSGPFGQVIGALRVENAIALLELGGERHESPVGVRLGLVAVFIATVGFFRWYLASFGSPDEAAAATGAEGPTL